MRISPSRHRVLAWTVAWGVAGFGLFVTDIWSDPPRGPLWIAIVLGFLAWGAAGAITMHHGRPVPSAIRWGLAYLLAFWLGAIGGAQFAEWRWPTFAGMLLGWSVGGGVGM